MHEEPRDSLRGPHRPTAVGVESESSGRRSTNKPRADLLFNLPLLVVLVDPAMSSEPEMEGPRLRKRRARTSAPPSSPLPRARVSDEPLKYYTRADVLWICAAALVGLFLVMISAPVQRYQAGSACARVIRENDCLREFQQNIIQGLEEIEERDKDVERARERIQDTFKTFHGKEKPGAKEMDAFAARSIRDFSEVAKHAGHFRQFHEKLRVQARATERCML